MKKLPILTGMLMAAALAASPATRAARPSLPADDGLTLTASQFALECSRDGTVTLSRRLSVRGGAGTMARDCTVTIPNDASLSFDQATIEGPFKLEFQGGTGSRLHVHTSRMLMGGAIQYTSGDYGKLEIRGSELSTSAGAPINLSPGGLGASTEIRDSVILSGEDLTVAASYFASRGRVFIDRTTLASGAGPYDRLVVYASLMSSQGLIEVANSSLTGTEKVEIRTGDVARTLVRGNLFSSEGPILILAAKASPCRSRDNVPAMECTWY
jgi:hypothetical protein